MEDSGVKYTQGIDRTSIEAYEQDISESLQQRGPIARASTASGSRRTVRFLPCRPGCPHAGANLTGVAVLKWMALVITFAVSVPSRAQQVTGAQGGGRDAGTEAAPSDSARAPGGLDKSFAANILLGKIESVASNRDSITLAGAGTSRRYKLSAGTTVLIEGRLGSAQDLKVGQRVRWAIETQRRGEDDPADRGHPGARVDPSARHPTWNARSERRDRRRQLDFAAGSRL